MQKKCNKCANGRSNGDGWTSIHWYFELLSNLSSHHQMLCIFLLQYLNWLQNHMYIYPDWSLISLSLMSIFVVNVTRESLSSFSFETKLPFLLKGLLRMLRSMSAVIPDGTSLIPEIPTSYCCKVFSFVKLYGFLR